MNIEVLTQEINHARSRHARHDPQSRTATHMSVQGNSYWRSPHEASLLPPQLEGRDIILVDDVFYTGRTIRAALNEIFDYGRPNQVVLAVLIERDGRQITMIPDCVGIKITLDPGQRIKLTGPDPLGVHLEHVKGAA